MLKPQQRTGLATAILPLVGLVYLGIVWLLSATRGSDESLQVSMVVLSYGGIVMLLTAWSSLHFAKRAGLCMMAITHLVWFAWPALKMLFSTDRYWGDIARYRVPLETVAETGLLILLFLGCNLLGYGLAYWLRREPGADTPTVHESDMKRVPNWVLHLMLLAGVLPYLVLGGGLTETLQAILSARSAAKPWDMGAHEASAYGPLIVVGRATLVTWSAICFWHFFFRKELKFGFRRSMADAAGAALGLLITFFDTGTRTWTMLIVGPTLLMMPLVAASQKRFLRAAVIAGAVLLLGMALAQLQRAYRFAGDFDEVTAGNVVQLDDNDFYVETAIAVHLVPERMDYVGQFDPWLFITNPIPRSIWPGKPHPLTVQLFTIGRARTDELMRIGTSRLPSIVGQQWMNFGVAGVIVAGLLYGLAFGGLERLIRTPAPASMRNFFVLMTLIWLFSAARALAPGFHYPVLFSALAWWSVRSRWATEPGDERAPPPKRAEPFKTRHPGRATTL